MQSYKLCDSTMLLGAASMNTVLVLGPTLLSLILRASPGVTIQHVIQDCN